MESGRFRTQAISLIAAYAVAMQVLLSAFVPAALATLADPLAVLCSHDGGGDGTGHPSRHELPCAAICAALGHGIAGSLPPAVVVAFAAPQDAVAPVPRSDWTPPRIAVRGRHTPRGPPLA